MNMLTLVWCYLKARPLNTLLNVLLLALGIAIITVLLLVSKQMKQKMSENSRGIDLVVGAKGSPLQLVLCNIFHADYPTGNIKLSEAEKISRNRLVKSAVPLALGDSYNKFRIVGTSQTYVDVFGAKLAEGKLWNQPMEVTIGWEVARELQLRVGNGFVSTHGLTVDGHAHEAKKFVVVGIFNKMNAVIDNLILTGVESVWSVHDITHGTENQQGLPSKLVPTVLATDSTLEITSLLIQYRSPMGAIQMPRWVNSQSSLQAASPAFETARLFSILGVGVEILKLFAYVIIFISGLSIFIALYNSLKERRYDLAMMRSMGASRQQLVQSILWEGAAITFLGTLAGLALAHAVLVLLPSFLKQAESAGVNGLAFYPEEWIILAASLLLGVTCAIIPSVEAYRTDISKTLAGNN